MSRTMAEMEVIGFLGRDPEMNYDPSGKPRCKFSIAHSWKKGDGTEITDWYNITAWGATAENSYAFLKKGSHVRVVGSFTSNVYQTNAGEWKVSNNVSANHVLFLDKANGEGGGASTSSADEPW